jgi:transposase
VSWSSREELVHRVVTLSQAKMSQRAIARALGISRNTVRSILEAHEAGRDAKHSAVPERKRRAPRPSKLDPFKKRVEELLAKYEDITAQRVFEILREEDFEGGYTAVKRHVRKVRPPPRPTPSLRAPDYGPGEMSESDWSPYEVRFTHAPPATVQAFSYVLVHSRRKFYDFFESNDLFALMEGHAGAFERFGGCAKACKYDGQKPVILRWEGSQAIYNPRFLAFATHYEFRPVGVRKANHKPRVERAFLEMERSFFNGREFRDFEDLRAQRADWNEHIVDQRKLNGSTALERFADEKPHLRALPRHGYDTARVVYRVCSIDGFVSWRGNRYAVPYEHVTDLLPVRITQRELFVYSADLRCIARHELGPRGAGLDLDPAQLHPPPRGRRSALDLERVRLAYEGMGEGAATFFRLISQGRARVWGGQVRQILLLRERYSTEDLDRALEHASRYGALTHAAVERILAARHTPRTLDEYVAQDVARKLEQTLGQGRTEARDLTEYDRLPLASSGPEEPWPDDAPPSPSPPTTSSSSVCDDTSDSSD